MTPIAYDWGSTDRLYELKAVTANGKKRSWMLNLNDEIKNQMDIDGEWSAAGTNYVLDENLSKNIAIAYQNYDCSDDDVSLSFS